MPFDGSFMAKAFPKQMFVSDVVKLAPGAKEAGPPIVSGTLASNQPESSAGQGTPPQNFKRSPNKDGSNTARNFDVQWRSKSETQNLTYMAKCFADGNTVIFNFEREVHLERVTITTPGEGKGPAAYSATITQHQQKPNGQVVKNQIHLCEDKLTQDPGEADLEILESGDIQCMSLQVEFWPLPGESTFNISQFHLFGFTS